MKIQVTKIAKRAPLFTMTLDDLVEIIQGGLDPIPEKWNKKTDLPAYIAHSIYDTRPRDKADIVSPTYLMQIDVDGSQAFWEYFRDQCQYTIFGLHTPSGNGYRILVRYSEKSTIDAAMEAWRKAHAAIIEAIETTGGVVETPTDHSRLGFIWETKDVFYRPEADIFTARENRTRKHIELPSLANMKHDNRYQDVNSIFFTAGLQGNDIESLKNEMHSNPHLQDEKFWRQAEKAYLDGKSKAAEQRQEQTQKARETIRKKKMEKLEDLGGLLSDAQLFYDTNTEGWIQRDTFQIKTTADMMNMYNAFVFDPEPQYTVKRYLEMLAWRFQSSMREEIKQYVHNAIKPNWTGSYGEMPFTSKHTPMPDHEKLYMWCRGVLRQILNPKKWNKLLLVFSGGEDIGKSTLLHWLLSIFPDALNVETIGYDERSFQYAYSRKLFTIMGELESMSERDFQSIKAMGGAQSSTFDEKYSNAKQYDRLTNMCATTNNENIQTFGSFRILHIPILKVDFDKLTDDLLLRIWEDAMFQVVNGNEHSL